MSQGARAGVLVLLGVVVSVLAGLASLIVFWARRAAKLSVPEAHAPGRFRPRARNEQHELFRGESITLGSDPLVVARYPQPIRPPETAGHSSHPYLEGVLGARRLRPFARRRLSTVRPAAVFMRERKPCLRRRRIRLGW